MSCLSVKVRRVGGCESSMERIGGMSAIATKVSGMTCRMGIICSTNYGGGILWASDGILFTLEGGYLITR